MADNRLKRLLENLFSDIPIDTTPEEASPEAAIKAEETDKPAPVEHRQLAEESRAPASAGALAEQIRRRTLQLQAASEISNAAASILDLDELLSHAVELIRERFDLYYTGIFLLDRYGQYAVLQTGTGKAGQQMVREGHQLEVGGSSMIGQCVATAQAHIALDVGEEAVRFSNPLLPRTRSEMALPLVSRGTAIGAMTIQSDRPAAFFQEDVTVLQSMADQLANAIENARLFEQRERRISELAAVNEIGQALTAPLHLDALLETVHQQVSHLFDTTNFYIATYEEGSDEWTSAFHLEGGQRQPLARYSIATGLTGYIIRTRQPILFHSIADNIRFNEMHGIEIIGEMAQSWLGVPLIAADRIVGAMAIQNYEHKDLYGSPELSLFSTIASQVANALENLRLFAETQRRAEQTQRLLEVSEATASTLDSTQVMRHIARAAAGALGADTTAAYVLDGTGTKLLPVAGYHVPPDKLEMYQQTVIPVDANPFVQEALQEQRIVLASNIATDARYSRTLLSQLMPAGSAVLTPMIAKDAVIGVLFAVWWEETHDLTLEERGLVEGIVRQAAIAIESARLFEETQARARRERILRQITTRVRGSTDPDTVMRTAVRELGTALGRPAFIRLDSNGSGQPTTEGDE